MLDISLHILDIVQNSVESGANQIMVSYFMGKCELINNSLIVTIKDNGKGILQSMVQKALNTDYSSSGQKSRGQGLPKLKKAAENTGGSVTIDSREGVGTTVKMTFDLDSPKMIDTGRISQTVLALVLVNRNISVIFDFNVYNNKISIDTRYINKKILVEKYPSIDQVQQLEKHIICQIESLHCNDYLF